MLRVFFYFFIFFAFNIHTILAGTKKTKSKKTHVETKKNKKEPLGNLCFRTSLTKTDSAQLKQFSHQDSVWFIQQEDSLIKYINDLQTDTNTNNVKKNDSLFILFLMQALSKPYSFYYDFPNLQQYIYITYSPDSVFRMITWQYSVNSLNVQQQGLMQVNTRDSLFKYFPLFDRSHLVASPLDTIFETPLWMGALYYKILLNFDNKNNKVYTLLGIDEHTVLSTKKWIEILTFNKNCVPIFGGDYFLFKKKTEINQEIKYNRYNRYNRFTEDKEMEDNDEPKKYMRFNIEYSKYINLNLKFDEDLGMIIYERLIPTEENMKKRKYTYVLDGNYEGFKWENGKWNHYPKVFEYTLPNETAPIENPLKFNDTPFPIK